MSTAVASRALAGLAPHLHACCTFCSDEAQQTVHGRFAFEAVTRGERLICYAEPSAQRRVRASMRAAGLDLKRLLGDGQVEMRPYGAYPERFEPAAGIAQVVADTARASVDGYTGLALTGLMSPAVAANVDIDRLAEYERGLQPLFEAGDVVGLCQYDARLLPKHTLARLVSPHDLKIDVGPHGATATHAGLTVTELVSGEFAVAGELDIAVHSYFRARMAEQLFGNDDLVVDVGGVTFIDATGCRVLHEIAQALPARRRLVLRRPTRHVARGLALCGWIGHPRIVVDLDSLDAMGPVR